MLRGRLVAFAVILLLAMGWFGIGVVTLAPKPDLPIMAAVFPPWWTARQAIGAVASSGAAILAAGALPTILIVHPEGKSGRVDRL